MKRKTDRNNQISLDGFQNSINRSFIISLSINSLLAEVRQPSAALTSSAFLGDSLHQLKWIASQVNELEEYMSDVFSEHPDHPYRLKILSLFREIPQHIEKAQSAIIYMNLQMVNDLDFDADKSKFGNYLYSLSNALTSLYNSLMNIKILNN